MYKNLVFNWSVCLLLHTQLFAKSYLWRGLTRIQWCQLTNSVRSLLVQDKDLMLPGRLAQYLLLILKLHNSTCTAGDLWYLNNSFWLFNEGVLVTICFLLFSFVRCHGRVSLPSELQWLKASRMCFDTVRTPIIVMYWDVHHAKKAETNLSAESWV